jgi:outer membrane protein assembly factor BamB
MSGRSLTRWIRRIHCAGMLFLSVAFNAWWGGAAANSADWPRFRGPNGAGISAEKNIPLECSAETTAWKVDLKGTGNSSPVVVGGKVYLQSATPTERVFHCLDLNTGAEQWNFKLPGAVGHTHKKNSLASCTASADAGRVFVPLWDGDKLGLYAFDAAGKKLWSYDLGSFVSQHGPGHAPICVDDKVLLFDETDDRSRLIAFEAASGKVLWEAKRPVTRTCYSTPVLRERDNGEREVVVTSTASISAYDLKTGANNWNWEWTGNKLRTVGSPVMGEGLVFISSGDGGGNRRIAAVRMDGRGDLPGSYLAWGRDKGFPYVPSMLTLGTHLYYISDKGIAGCVVAKTGEEVWSERIGGNYSASPLIIDGKIYLFSEDGELTVIAAGPAFEKLASSNLGESITATPAVADGKLVIRGSTHVFAFSAAKKVAAK